MYSFPNVEPVHSMYSSNCCFLTCIQVSGRQVRRSVIPISLRIFHSLLSSRQLKALAWSLKQKYMFFWNFLAFYMIQQMLQFDLCLVPLSFLNPAYTSGSSQFKTGAVFHPMRHLVICGYILIVIIEKSMSYPFGCIATKHSVMHNATPGTENLQLQLSAGPALRTSALNLQFPNLQFPG